MVRFAFSIALLALCGLANAAPDEVLLGRDAGYPMPPRPALTHQPQYMVASFSGMDKIVPHCNLAPSPDPVTLKVAEPQRRVDYRYEGRWYTLDDYMQHQRATAVLVLKDGEIVAERYNYARTADMRMLSNSMAKTIAALAIGKAIEDGSIHSIEDPAERYVDALKDTLMGGTRIVDLLRMASGAHYVEDYSPNDDRARFNSLASREGLVAALRSLTLRDAPPGEKFNYSGPHTEVLGLVVRGATHKTLCEYVAESIWQPMGAESMASYLTRPDGTEFAQGGFNATAHDYARLGAMLANDGQVRGRQVIPREWVLQMTDAARQPPQFRPGAMDYHGSKSSGYGLQTWLLPAETRQFALQGIYGQAIFVDPARKLVLVHLAVGKDASGDASGTRMHAEKWALWRGVQTMGGF